MVHSLLLDGKDYSLVMEKTLGQALRESRGPMLLTGHTGFKGTWMTLLLAYLKVPVVGYSLAPEKDSLFERSNRVGAIPEVFADIRDYDVLEKFIDDMRPSTIIHMAAQPLVLKSYEQPLDTFDINVMGTAKLLDIASKKKFVKAIAIITTDKVYKNDNSSRAFTEEDCLEGKDPYSASKVGAESVVSAWQQISKISGGPAILSARAGNVIGGGDFAQDRLIPDLIRSLPSGNLTEIRNPEYTRPWQHVLDPLVGYLMAVESLLKGRLIESINFGPDDESISVRNLVIAATSTFPELKTSISFSEATRILKESEKLQLNSNLAKELLNWSPRWTSHEAIQLSFRWWKEVIELNANPIALCKRDIENYFY